MIRLIVCDIDGTLIGEDEKVPSRALDVLKKVKECGVFFTLATGRSDCTTRNLASSFGCGCPFITCNGASIIDLKGNVYFRKKFAISLARDIMVEAGNSGLSVVYTLDGEEFTTDSSAEYQQKRVRMGCRAIPERPLSASDWKYLKTEKVSIMSSFDDKEIAFLEEECRKHFLDFNYTRYMDRSVELVAPGVSKASGVDILSSILGIPISDIMFVGDSQNDTSLIKHCGLGVAVANATSDAKAAADYVCSSSMFDGVSEAISRFVLEVV